MKAKNLFSLLALLLCAALLPACTGNAPAEESGSDPVPTGTPTGAPTAPLSEAPTEVPTEVPTEPAGARRLEPDSAFFTGEYYADTVSTEALVAAGVMGKTNLFAPGAPIPVWLLVGDPALDGTEGTVKFTSSDRKTRLTETFTVTANREMRFCFAEPRNGICTVALTVGGRDYSFSVGILPENPIASGDFYYGIQPYVARVLTWGSGSYVADKDESASVAAILDTAEYLGVNLIREDGPGWSAMQKSAAAPVDFTRQDLLVSAVRERGMKLDWIVASTPEWAVKAEYAAGTEAAWQKCPDETAWKNFFTAIAGHYAADPSILFEIRNEPDWSFFTGTAEEYLHLLEIAARELRAVNPSAYIFAGGLALGDKSNPNYHAPEPYFAGYRRLMDEGLIDNYAYHIHSALSTYFTKMNSLGKLVSDAGLPGGAINSESGLGSPDPGALMVKALYTRSRGDLGFVQFSFRKTPKPSGDVDKFAIFDEHLCPTESAIAYGTLIRFLGNSRFEGSAFHGSLKNVDIYTDAEGNTVAVFYNNGASNCTASLPEGSFTLYDLYGNPAAVPKGNVLTLRDEPVYAVYEGKIPTEAFAK